MGEKPELKRLLELPRDTTLAVLLFQLVIVSCVVSFSFQFDCKLLESKNYVLNSFMFSFLPRRILSNNRHPSKRSVERKT